MGRRALLVIGDAVVKSAGCACGVRRRSVKHQVLLMSSKAALHCVESAAYKGKMVFLSQCSARSTDMVFGHCDQNIRLSLWRGGWVHLCGPAAVAAAAMLLLAWRARAYMVEWSKAARCVLFRSVYQWVSTVLMLAVARCLLFQSVYQWVSTVDACSCVPAEERQVESLQEVERKWGVVLPP